MSKLTQALLPFSSDTQLTEMGVKYGTPLFVHDEQSYRRYGNEALSAPNAFGLSVRYAMKANSHRAVLRIFNKMGIRIDSSSYYEVLRAKAAGIEAYKIQLTSQENPDDAHLKEIVKSGVICNCTSLAQLRLFAGLFPGHTGPLAVRINPGLGSGHNKRTSTGGPAASFGIWHEYLPEVLNIAKNARLAISILHTHIGSGSDWKVWQKAARLTLAIAKQLPDVTVVNLGGGYRIDRINPEDSMDFQAVFSNVKKAFEEFASETGRKLKMEIEPGTFLTANSCILLARVNDLADTGAHGYRFLKLDASMTDLLRPMIYGARHPIRLLGKSGDSLLPYVVVGSCCESGDIFTPAEGNPEEIDTAQLPRADIGDYVAIMGAGAYGIAMSAKNYNSHPICAEVMIRENGKYRLISRAQKPEEIWEREI